MEDLPTLFFKARSLRQKAELDDLPTPVLTSHHPYSPDIVLQGMQPSAESLTGRPPDIVLQSTQPSAEFLTGRPPDTVLEEVTC